MTLFEEIIENSCPKRAIIYKGDNLYNMNGDAYCSEFESLEDLQISVGIVVHNNDSNIKAFIIDGKIRPLVFYAFDWIHDDKTFNNIIRSRKSDVEKFEKFMRLVGKPSIADIYKLK